MSSYARGMGQLLPHSPQKETWLLTPWPQPLTCRTKTLSLRGHTSFLGSPFVAVGHKSSPCSTGGEWSLTSWEECPQRTGAIFKSLPKPWDTQPMVNSPLLSKLTQIGFLHATLRCPCWEFICVSLFSNGFLRINFITLNPRNLI